MSKKNKRKKKKGYGKIVFSGLLILVCLAAVIGLASGALPDMVQSAVEKKVARQVMEEAVKKALESSGDPQAAAKAKEIIDNMEEADKQKAEEIIGKYANSETLSDCMEILGEGVNEESLEEIQDYLVESVSAEDQAQLMELYQKYGGMY